MNKAHFIIIAERNHCQKCFAVKHYHKIFKMKKKPCYKANNKNGLTTPMNTNEKFSFSK